MGGIASARFTSLAAFAPAPPGPACYQGAALTYVQQGEAGAIAAIPDIRKQVLRRASRRSWDDATLASKAAELLRFRYIMTIITVTTPEGRLSIEQRRELAETLTDAVLVPEVGQLAPPARIGFQIHFAERTLDRMAIGGRLFSDMPQPPDVATIDICVMDAAWPPAMRKKVTENVLAAMAKACGLASPSPSWWTTFRTIDEGSWGSRGGVLSILDLLASGVFTPERVAEIRKTLA